MNEPAHDGNKHIPQVITSPLSVVDCPCCGAGVIWNGVPLFQCCNCGVTIDPKALAE